MGIAAFNSYLSYAQHDLRRAGISQKHKRGWLLNAYTMTRWALSEANRMHDRKRAGLCLKILNWLRADLRRLAA